MSFDIRFMPITIDELPAKAQQFKDEHYRFIQILCVTGDDGINVQYSFMKDGVIENYTITGVKKGMKVPSITDKFLAAFVFENEGHDLFGVEFDGSLLDFKGKFYALSEKEPMNVISPAQQAARDKAAKEAGGNSKPSPEDKMKDMDPEKAAKLKAAMEAKAAREAAKAAKGADKKEGE